MIARLLLALPFYIAVSEGIEFSIYTYEEEGYAISTFPPARSDRPPPGDVPDIIKINDQPAFLANGLCIEFRKESFNRLSGSPSDPPETVLTRAVASFLNRLLYVTQGAQVRMLDWSQSSWLLRYLNDDGSELAEDAPLRRGLGSANFAWSWVGLDKQVWESIHDLPPNYVPPAWNGLILGAEAALPNIGVAVVLGSTCLEVFIEQILDDLAKKSQLPADLWGWVNNRSDWSKEPNTEERFDVLLKHFTTRSLKEDKSLWEAFKNLRTARNTFVHEGLAKVGNKLITSNDAARLVSQARAIIRWTRELLPEDLKWPEFKSTITFTIEQELMKQENTLPR